MTFSKRLFDICFALILLIPLGAIMLVTALVILIRDGRPVIYVSERMHAPGKPFDLIKFRTMRHSDEDQGVSGGHKDWRVTPLGAFLRKTRLDELPQLFNILKGDISFVGPRPPMREYVERQPEIYAEVLKSWPGVTGLASLVYHRHEEHILRQCKTAAETDATYVRRCIPAKAKLDLIYQKNRTLCLDLWVIWTTLQLVVIRRGKQRGGPPRPPRRTHPHHQAPAETASDHS
ncbi:sugar transferase [Paracoccus pacificus]|uniref:Sugar transferase n=1 Tax=Paracoccus pacificus TaxID=1463598 RepID=A0ABW4R7M6_9RHOB